MKNSGPFIFDVLRWFHSQDKGKTLSGENSNRRLPFFQIFFCDLFSQTKGESSFLLQEKIITQVSLSLDYPCSSMELSGSFRPRFLSSSAPDFK